MSDIVGDPDSRFISQCESVAHNLDFFLVFFSLSELRDINSKTLCFDFFSSRFTFHNSYSETFHNALCTAGKHNYPRMHNMFS